MKRYRVMAVLAAAMMLTACASGEGSVTEIAAQTTVKITETAVSSQTTSAQTTQTAAVQSTAVQSAWYEEVTLTAEQEQIVRGVIDAKKKRDIEALKRISNMQFYLEIAEYEGSDISDPAYLEEVLDEIADEDIDTYTLTSSARRHDLLTQYDRLWQEGEEELEGMSPEKKEKLGKMLENFKGVTEIVTAEIDYTDSEGYEEHTAVPLFLQNGKWQADLFILRMEDLPLTREDAIRSQKRDIEVMRSYLGSAYKYVKKNITIASVLEGRDIVWKADMLENSEAPVEQYENDPMQNLRYQMHKRCKNLSDYAEIRFLLEDDKCIAVAAQRKDGFIWCGLYDNNIESFASLDEAFAHAKAQAYKLK